MGASWKFAANSIMNDPEQQAQTSEIGYMNELLLAKGAAPVDAPAVDDGGGHQHTAP